MRGGQVGGEEPVVVERGSEDVAHLGRPPVRDVRGEGEHEHDVLVGHGESAERVGHARAAARRAAAEARVGEPDQHGAGDSGVRAGHRHRHRIRRAAEPGPQRGHHGEHRDDAEGNDEAEPGDSERGCADPGEYLDGVTDGGPCGVLLGTEPQLWPEGPPQEGARDRETEHDVRAEPRDGAHGNAELDPEEDQQRGHQTRRDPSPDRRARAPAPAGQRLRALARCRSHRPPFRPVVAPYDRDLEE